TDERTVRTRRRGHRDCAGTLGRAGCILRRGALDLLDELPQRTAQATEEWILAVLQRDLGQQLQPQRQRGCLIRFREQPLAADARDDLEQVIVVAGLEYQRFVRAGFAFRGGEVFEGDAVAVLFHGTPGGRSALWAFHLSCKMVAESALRGSSAPRELHACC